MSFTENTVLGVTYMTAPNIKATHAFTTRFGGVSTGVCESLNLGLNLGDDPERVRDNYELLRRAMEINDSGFACSNQTHGSEIRIVTASDCNYYPALPSDCADGLITKARRVALTIFVADCAPILLHDPVRNVIGAVHAGWRGTVSDIAGAAVQKMIREFYCSPADISAAIGPCISKCCYETGTDVADALRSALCDSAESCITPRNEKFMIDIKEANRLLLIRAGLRSISVSDECTSCRSDKYWSHRRTNGARGSQAAIITL